MAASTSAPRRRSRTDAQLGDAVRAHAQTVKSALSQWRASYDYYNFLETPADADAVLPHASTERLREIKAIYDPDQTIVSTHPPRPPGRQLI
jgi:hypothetical protein